MAQVNNTGGEEPSSMRFLDEFYPFKGNQPSPMQSAYAWVHKREPLVGHPMFNHLFEKEKRK
jgi:hypothetical protein